MDGPPRVLVGVLPRRRGPGALGRLGQFLVVGGAEEEVHAAHRAVVPQRVEVAPLGDGARLGWVANVVPTGARHPPGLEKKQGRETKVGPEWACAPFGVGARELGRSNMRALVATRGRESTRARAAHRSLSSKAAWSVVS